MATLVQTVQHQERRVGVDAERRPELLAHLHGGDDGLISRCVSQNYGGSKFVVHKPSCDCGKVRNVKRAAARAPGLMLVPEADLPSCAYILPASDAAAFGRPRCRRGARSPG